MQHQLLNRHHRPCPAARRPLCRAPRSILSNGSTAKKSASQPETGAQLRLFLDSANISQWDMWLRTNMFYGVTTNPVILEQDQQRCTLSNLTRMTQMAAEMGAKEVHLQTWGQNSQQMVHVALDLYGINPNLVVVKVPSTMEGFQAAALLRENSVRTTMTGMYASPQVLLAHTLGADYAAPYLGRMDDAYGKNQGLRQVLEMQKILTSQNSKTRLLVASIRDAATLATLAAEGCDTFTITPAVAEQIFNVSYTTDAADAFEQAARRNGAYGQDPSTILPRPPPGMGGVPASQTAPATGQQPPKRKAPLF